MDYTNENQTKEELRGNTNTIDLDPQKLKDMVSRIYDAEKRNTKNKQKSDSAMKSIIENIIVEVANKWF